MARRLLPLLLAVLLLPACDSAAEFVIGGTYTSVTEGDGTTTTVTYDIPETESGGQFTFEVTVARATASGTTESVALGGGTYEHPALLLTVEDEALGGTVAADGGSFRLEVGPGEFLTFTRR